jgi:superfamily I DNA/RNA helicase
MADLATRVEARLPVRSTDANRSVMKTLGNVTPTPEQATVIDDAAPGFWLIQGAAGSGKTTTAVLRLKFLVRFWRERRVDMGIPGPVRVLVLTFNRTLRGYIQELTQQQIQSGPDVALEVSTFAAWAQGLLARVVLDRAPMEAKIRQLAGNAFPWRSRFLLDEVDYVLGRFLPEDLEQYLTTERTGRGRAPRVDRPLRERLLRDVIEPYEAWKHERGVVDWSDLAVELAKTQATAPYDIVIADETQDFSANQIRAIANHLADNFVCTFIRDTVQRIYANYFTWPEVGVPITASHSRRLNRNYRNTKQTAAFALPLVEGLEPVEDDALPDFQSCDREGRPPTVLRGKYSAQAAWALRYIHESVAQDRTVAFLHPLGGGWFTELRRQLDEAGILWVSLTREAEWPEGDEQVALSTMHSAKGLEFDHVLLLGYDADTVQTEANAEDVSVDQQRRLLAMAVGRAREGVVIGYRPEAEPPVAAFFAAGTYELIEL